MHEPPLSNKKKPNCSQISDANRSPYLFVRSRTYYLRKRINIRDIKRNDTLNKTFPREIKFSLGTNDFVVAIAAAKVFSELTNRFAYLLNSQNTEKVRMATLVIKAQINKVLTAMNLANELAAMPLEDPEVEAMSMCASEDQGCTLSTKASKHLRLSAEQQFSSHLRSSGIIHDTNGAPFKVGVSKLVRRKQYIGSLAQAQQSEDYDKEMEFLKEADKYASFPMSPTSPQNFGSDPLLLTLGATRRLYLEEEHDIDWERWCNCTTYRSDKENDRAKKMDEAITEVICYLGDRAIHQYSKRDFKGMFKLMEHMPQYRAKNHSGLSLSELESKDWTTYKNAKGVEKDITLSFSTIDKYRQKTRQLFKWVMEQLEDDDTTSKLISSNPVASKLHKSKNKSLKNKSWSNLTEQELSAMWQCDNFKNANQNWQYWIPILMRSTGARPNEISQLTVNDVYVEKITIDETCEEHMYYLKLTDKTVFQSVKNDTSKRNIPIHPLLIKLGFAEFVQYQKSHKQPHQSLWNGLKMRGGYYATNFRNWFSKNILEDTAVIPERFDEDGCKKVLYSFRSTYVTSFLEQGLIKATLQQLIGHVDQEHAQITNRYTKAFQREFMYKELCKYEMPDIEALVQAMPSTTKVKAT